MAYLKSRCISYDLYSYMSSLNSHACMHAKGFSVSQFLDRLRAGHVQWLVCHHHRILIAFNRTMSNGAIPDHSSLCEVAAV